MEDEAKAAMKEYVDGLRAVASFLEDRPELGVPDVVSFNIYCYTAEELAGKLRMIGSFDKVESEYLTAIGRKNIGGHHIDVFAAKSITCSQVPTGEMKKEKRTVSSIDEIPAGGVAVGSVIEYEVEVPVMKWDCGSLLDPKPSVSSF